MNVFDKTTTTTPDFWNVINDYNFKRATADEIVKEGFLGNELVYACVSTLARACAVFPTVLMDGDNIVTDVNDPVYKLYFGNWNTKHGKSEEMYQLFVNLFLHGKSHILKESESIGLQTTELWSLPTQAVTPAQEQTGYFDQVPYYIFNDGVKQYKYFPSELITLEYYDPSTLQEQQLGLSPLQGVWDIVNASNNRATAEKAMLENRGIAGIISPKAASGDAGALGFSNSVMDLVRKAFAGIAGGAEKFNKVEVVEQAVDFTQLGMNATDMKVIEMQLPHIRSVCRALNLPSQKFGDYQSSQYANYVEADRVFYTGAVMPNVELFLNQFQKGCLNHINMVSSKNYHVELDPERVEQLQTTTEETASTTTEENE
jgi:HK97 family phage portal protein